LGYEVEPIGQVRGGRREAIDDDWGAVRATIELDPDQWSADALAGLDAFSHLDVVYLFHQVDPDGVTRDARHPRGNTAWPRVGIFAQRARMRPNRLGVTTCRLLSVDGLSVRVQGLDAIDGSPVIDLKPHVREFAASGTIEQPQWMTELMANYWVAEDSPIE
jgi:tRNA-Thr(GGU) m(6)t(6)A37 methyltransferase TsaA